LHIYVHQEIGDWPIENWLDGHRRSLKNTPDPQLPTTSAWSGVFTSGLKITY
jgi:hypothetical protein